jgi:hypothetical protein
MHYKGRLWNPSNQKTRLKLRRRRILIQYTEDKALFSGMLLFLSQRLGNKELNTAFPLSPVYGNFLVSFRVPNWRSDRSTDTKTGFWIVLLITISPTAAMSKSSDTTAWRIQVK